MPRMVVRLSFSLRMRVFSNARGARVRTRCTSWVWVMALGSVPSICCHSSPFLFVNTSPSLIHDSSSTLFLLRSSTIRINPGCSFMLSSLVLLVSVSYPVIKLPRIPCDASSISITSFIALCRMRLDRFRRNSVYLDSRHEMVWHSTQITPASRSIVFVMFGEDAAYVISHVHFPDSRGRSMYSASFPSSTLSMNSGVFFF